MKRSKWATGKLHHAQVCTSFEEASRLAKGVNTGNNNEVAKAFRRYVKAGRATVEVGMIVIRAKVADAN